MRGSGPDDVAIGGVRKDGGGAELGLDQNGGGAELDLDQHGSGLAWRRRPSTRSTTAQIRPPASPQTTSLLAAPDPSPPADLLHVARQFCGGPAPQQLLTQICLELAELTLRADGLFASETRGGGGGAEKEKEPEAAAGEGTTVVRGCGKLVETQDFAVAGPTLEAM